jgi:hypothetical protein
MLSTSIRNTALATNTHLAFLVSGIQGDVIKKGQVIGYLDQFGTELPVKVNKIFQFLYFCDFFSIVSYHGDFFLLC